MTRRTVLPLWLLLLCWCVACGKQTTPAFDTATLLGVWELTRVEGPDYTGDVGPKTLFLIVIDGTNLLVATCDPYNLSAPGGCTSGNYDCGHHAYSIKGYDLSAPKSAYFASHLPKLDPDQAQLDVDQPEGQPRLRLSLLVNNKLVLYTFQQTKVSLPLSVQACQATVGADLPDTTTVADALQGDVDHVDVDGVDAAQD